MMIIKTKYMSAYKVRTILAIMCYHTYAFYHMQLNLCMGNGNILAIISSHFTGIATNSLTAASSATTAPIPNTESDSAVTIAAVIVVLIIAAMLAAVIGLVVILVIFRRRAKKTVTAALCNDSLNELKNPVYSGMQA